MSETSVFHVTLYTKAYPIAFFITNEKMKYIIDNMSVLRKSRDDLHFPCYPDIDTMRNRPDLYYNLDLEGKAIYGYSFSDRGLLEAEEKIVKIPISEGIH